MAKSIDGLKSSTEGFSNPIPNIIACIPRETARHNIQRQYNLLTFDPDEGLLRLAMVASRAFGTQVVAISFMGEKEHFMRATVGFDVHTVAKENSLCTLTYLNEFEESYIVPDTLEHPLTQHFHFVQNPPYLRFYAASNVFLDGVKVGTFCLCDPKARIFTEREISLLNDLAGCVSDLLSMRWRQWMKNHLSNISASLGSLETIKSPLQFVVDDATEMRKVTQRLYDCFDAGCTEVGTPEKSQILTPSQSEMCNISSDVRKLLHPMVVSDDSSCDLSIENDSESGPKTRSSSFLSYHPRRCEYIERLDELADGLRTDVFHLERAIDHSIHKMLNCCVSTSRPSSRQIAKDTLPKLFFQEMPEFNG